MQGTTQYFRVITESHEGRQWEYPVSGSRSKAGKSRIQDRINNHSATMRNTIKQIPNQLSLWHELDPT